MTADLLALLERQRPDLTPAERLAMIEATPDARREKPARKPVSARVGSRPRTDASMARRRSWAASGRLPARLACHFTLAEQAVLCLIADEVKKRGACTRTLESIAAAAGVCKTSVRNAIRQAKALGLVTVEESRKTAWMSNPNTVRIVSPEWAAHLRLYGCKSVHPTATDSRKGSESRSTPTAQKGFRQADGRARWRETRF